MEIWLVVAVLLAALLQASWNALVKVGALPFAGAVLLFTGRPDPTALPYVAASSLAQLAYGLCLGHAYRTPTSASSTRSRAASRRSPWVFWPWSSRARRWKAACWSARSWSRAASCCWPPRVM